MNSSLALEVEKLKQLQDQIEIPEIKDDTPRVEELESEEMVAHLIDELKYSPLHDAAAEVVSHDDGELVVLKEVPEKQVEDLEDEQIQGDNAPGIVHYVPEQLAKMLDVFDSNVNPINPPSIEVVATTNLLPESLVTVRELLAFLKDQFALCANMYVHIASCTVRQFTDVARMEYFRFHANLLNVNVGSWLTPHNVIGYSFVKWKDCVSDFPTSSTVTLRRVLLLREKVISEFQEKANASTIGVVAILKLKIGIHNVLRKGMIREKTAAKEELIDAVANLETQYSELTCVLVRTLKSVALATAKVRVTPETAEITTNIASHTHQLSPSERIARVLSLSNQSGLGLMKAYADGGGQFNEIDPFFHEIKLLFNKYERNIVELTETSVKSKCTATLSRTRRFNELMTKINDISNKLNTHLIEELHAPAWTVYDLQLLFLIDNVIATLEYEADVTIQISEVSADASLFRALRTCVE